MSQKAPLLLTGSAVLGVFGTAALSARAGYLVGLDVNAGHYEPLLEGGEPERLTAKDKVRLYWTTFIPTAVVGTATVASILGSNHISTSRAGAALAAYSVVEKSFHQYKEAVIDQIGENREEKIRTSVAQDRMTNEPVTNRQVIIAGGEALCLETTTGRYFTSSMETLRSVQNDLNERIINEMYVSQNDLFRALGLPTTSFGDQVGWNTSRMLSFDFQTALSDDGRPCIVLDYVHLPVPEYSTFH